MCHSKSVKELVFSSRGAQVPNHRSRIQWTTSYCIGQTCNTASLVTTITTDCVLRSPSPVIVKYLGHFCIWCFGHGISSAPANISIVIKKLNVIKNTITVMSTIHQSSELFTICAIDSNTIIFFYRVTCSNVTQRSKLKENHTQCKLLSIM